MKHNTEHKLEALAASLGLVVDGILAASSNESWSLMAMLVEEKLI